MSWYIAALKKYAVFSGRARRKEYWYFALFNMIFCFILVFIDVFTGLFHEQVGFGVLSTLYMLATLLPSLGVTVRRLHDTGRSGWWILISLVPFIGGLILLIFTLLDSKPGENQYGPNPKEVAG